MKTRKCLWKWMAAFQLLGVALCLLGSEVSAILQLSGYIALFPGSVIAAEAALDKLWRPIMWKHWQTDEWGLSNLLYLPVAVAINCIFFWILMEFRRRKTSKI